MPSAATPALAPTSMRRSIGGAYVPLSFAPGEAYQFDWSHEVVLINGTTVIVKVAHVRLCHSRMLFVRAYPRETQEMVFDAHDRAFAFFKGACTRGIYDNMKTAVETIFVGKERLYNRRFLQMCSHFLVDPVACTPASGWEKGQVENQVGLVRERFFAPRLRVKSYDELNAWLLDKCDRLRQGAPSSRVQGSDDLAGVRGGAGQAWCPIQGGSTGSMPCRPRCRRPAGALRQQPLLGGGECGRASGRGGLSGISCVGGHNGKEGDPQCPDVKNLRYRMSFSTSCWQAATRVRRSTRAGCSIR